MYFYYWMNEKEKRSTFSLVIGWGYSDISYILLYLEILGFQITIGRYL